MGLIGKIALIGIVSVAVLIAVIWDWQNQGRLENTRTANGEDIEKNLPENIVTEETPNPETPQDQTPAAIEQQEEPSGQAAPIEQPETPEPSDEQPRPPAVEPGPEMPDPPAGGEKYVIQKQDTLYKIAQKFYGNGKLWPRIAAANGDSVPDPEVLKVGTEIMIPALEEALRHKPIPVPPAVETYIVQKGDTLSSISRMHYGNNSGVELIYQTNRDRIENKNILKPGTVLVIPPALKNQK